ncbi:MAG TPA: hypothetical protein VHX49_01360 [Candidatus Acidoferrales bacterium]|nr:hypothetical protein [Candidatus Acidoferrales bacterium]
MKHFGRLFLVSLVLAVVPLAAYAQTPLWSGIISPSRAVNWSDAGVRGGIPTNRTQCGSTIAPYGSGGSPASPATINNAIAACPGGTYVLLGSGTFYLSAGIREQAPTNNVTIRGMGADETFVVFSGSDPCGGQYADVCFESGDVNWSGGSSNSTTWTASNYVAGQTTLTFAAVPNLKVGNPVMLDQLDDTTVNDAVMVCAQNSTIPYCSGQGNSGGAQRPNRNETQVVTVTGCNGITAIGTSCSGTNVAVTISPGLYMPNWSPSKSLGAWWASSPQTGGAIEDISLDHTASASKGVLWFNATNGWAKGVRSIDAERSHFMKIYADHITVENSYMYLTYNAATQSYGVESFGSSDGLTVNNICQLVVTCENENSFTEGDAVLYNYSVYSYFTLSAGYLVESTAAHTAGIDMVLYEGNKAGSMDADAIHGSHNFLTLFRNYILGNQPSCWGGGSGYTSMEPCNNGLIPMQLQSYTHFTNVIGNLLGQTGIQGSYQSGTGGGVGTAGIYALGPGYSDGTSGLSVAEDSSVAATLLRWGNCDAIHGFAAASCQFNSSEIPVTGSLITDQQPYANSVPSSHTLPASLYYSSTPSWWPSSKPFPPIGPDVTGGNEPGTGGLAYTIPAEDCYLSVMNGPSNGAGSALTFNENACYGSSSLSSNPPDAPTNLTAAVE